MRKELDDQLCKEFPELYADRNASMHTTCMYWGFECNDGWFPLIYDLSKQLTSLIRALPESERADYKAVQVKEKFGTLRFYMSQETDEMSKLIGQAEEDSGMICESCGEPGKIRTGGWISTLCDYHCKGNKDE